MRPIAVLNWQRGVGLVFFTGSTGVLSLHAPPLQRGKVGLRHPGRRGRAKHGVQAEGRSGKHFSLTDPGVRSAYQG
jgi:hypothetical protein